MPRASRCPRPNALFRLTTRAGLCLFCSAIRIPRGPVLRDAAHGLSRAKGNAPQRASASRIIMFRRITLPDVTGPMSRGRSRGAGDGGLSEADPLNPQ